MMLKVIGRSRFALLVITSEGHKTHAPYTFTVSEKKVMNDPELAKVVEKWGGEMDAGVNPPC